VLFAAVLRRMTEPQSLAMRSSAVAANPLTA